MRFDPLVLVIAPSNVKTNRKEKEGKGLLSWDPAFLKTAPRKTSDQRYKGIDKDKKYLEKHWGEAGFCENVSR